MEKQKYQQVKNLKKKIIIKNIKNDEKRPFKEEYENATPSEDYDYQITTDENENNSEFTKKSPENIVELGNVDGNKIDLSKAGPLPQF